MIIRDYEPSDWGAVCKIYDLAKPDELRGLVEVASIPRLEDDPPMLALFRVSSVIVADDEGCLTGFAGCKGSYIGWLFVHPAHRRKGVATALIRTLIERASGELTLNVAYGNEAARAVYERLGFAVAQDFAGEYNGQPIRVLKLRHPAS
jgi:ribosomal protein S18 acetylase RimI-like enzyme